MAKFVLIKHLADKWPETVVRVADGQSTDKIVSKFQEKLRSMGMSDGVAFQAHEGDFISAMIASERL